MRWNIKNLLAKGWDEMEPFRMHSVMPNGTKQPCFPVALTVAFPVAFGGFHEHNISISDPFRPAPCEVGDTLLQAGGGALDVLELR